MSFPFCFLEFDVLPGLVVANIVQPLANAVEHPVEEPNRSVTNTPQCHCEAENGVKIILNQPERYPAYILPCEVGNNKHDGELFASEFELVHCNEALFGDAESLQDLCHVTRRNYIIPHLVETNGGVGAVLLVPNQFKVRVAFGFRSQQNVPVIIQNALQAFAFQLGGRESADDVAIVHCRIKFKVERLLHSPSQKETRCRLHSTVNFAGSILSNTVQVVRLERLPADPDAPIAVGLLFHAKGFAARRGVHVHVIGLAILEATFDNGAFATDDLGIEGGRVERRLNGQNTVEAVDVVLGAGGLDDVIVAALNNGVGLKRLGNAVASDDDGLAFDFGPDSDGVALKLDVVSALRVLPGEFTGNDLSLECGEAANEGEQEGEQ